MVIDLAEPWTLLPAARAALRPGAVLVAYVPTVLQVKQFVDAARGAGFGAVQISETLLRPWHVRGLSIRPEHRMVAHTGFVITCRRLVSRRPRASGSRTGRRSRTSHGDACGRMPTTTLDDRLAPRPD